MVYYVADADIADLDPCLFGGRNPVSGKRYSGCASGFQNMNDIINKIKDLKYQNYKKIH